MLRWKGMVKPCLWMRLNWAQEKQLRVSAPFDVGLPDTKNEISFGQTRAMEVCRRSIGDVRQNGEPSAVRTAPANPEGSVPRRRTELVYVVE